MRRIEFSEGVFAELLDDCTWIGSRESLVSCLNGLAKIDLAELSPADGNPPDAIFARAVEVLNPRRVINNTSYTTSEVH